MKTLRVLIVEDEPLLAMDLESIVTDTVSAAVIVKSSVAGAKKFLDSQFLDSQFLNSQTWDPQALGSRVDVAFLDVDVTNGKTFGLARILDRGHIPYAFVSGSKADELPLELRKSPFFAKPVGRREVEYLLKAVSASS
jgi:DNA-binding LytR/AlgR family response regulator